MNALLIQLGLEGLKPLASALLMPPTPWLLLALPGALLTWGRRRLGLALLLFALLATWLSCTLAAGQWLLRTVFPEVEPLAPIRIMKIAEEVRAGTPRTAVIVLGGGREAYAVEYAAPSLSGLTLARLRYGIWLARRTGAPLGFSGGVGHGSRPGPSEAQIAEAIAAELFMTRLRWTESRSRDTRENAAYTVPLLAADGIERVLLVTHAAHMRRAQRAFRDAAHAAGWQLEVIAAPIGHEGRSEHGLGRWLPGVEGLRLVRYVLHEQLGLWVGA